MINTHVEWWWISKNAWCFISQNVDEFTPVKEPSGQSTYTSPSAGFVSYLLSGMFQQLVFVAMWVKQCHKPCPISAMGVINHSQMGGLLSFAHINFDWCFMSERRSEHGMRAHKGRPTPHWLCDMWASCLDFGSAPNPMVDQFIIIFSWRLLVWYPPWGFSMAHHGASRPWFGMRQKDRSYFGFGHFMWKSSQCCCLYHFICPLFHWLHSYWEPPWLTPSVHFQPAPL